MLGRADFVTQKQVFGKLTLLIPVRHIAFFWVLIMLIENIPNCLLKKRFNPLLRISVKVVGIPRGSMQKNGKFHGKFD